VIDEDDPGLQLVHLLRGLTMEFGLFGAEFAAGKGMHPTDLRALIHLLDAARTGVTASPGWLGARLRLNSASTTELIDRLEGAGHVRRQRDTGDRRRVQLVVDERAVALGWSYFGPLIGELVGSMRTFTPSELEVVQRFLLAMTEVVVAARRGD
jgi:DNA-binding MarR family transcriptional regulator